MVKQIGPRNPGLPVAALEERMTALEGRMTALADAVRVLAHGLEDLPTLEPGGRPVAEAARRAYELLLIAEPPHPPDSPAGVMPDA